ncbi:MAG: hypothetical protein B7C24_16880 [Bacteroidetes bacterium 4572_77]|nr:MAG: hypothetical protein B7C24_16880 [Bacteroidetes bacterium 4572_77]
MDIFLSILAIVLGLIGLAGAIIPILPGPVFSFLGLLSLYFTKMAPFEERFMGIWLLFTVLITAIDQIVPVLGAKKMGASKYGINGAIVGLLLGIFLFPPIGIIVGPFLGALVGELLHGNDFNSATKAGFGSLLGFLGGTFLKLVFSLIAFYYIVINWTIGA